jgi:outer membrane protein assembly factor BamB
MKFSKSKTTTIAIALFLMFAIAVSLVALPAANAHDPPMEIPTFAYISASPDPVGVGQKVDVIMWLDKIFSPDSALTNDYRFHNYKLTITKPDGTTETMTWDIVQDPTSSQYTPYTPDQVGEYTFKFEFPGQDYTEYSHNPASIYVNDTWLPSSASTTITVQEEPLPDPISSYPLPAEYWTRPIYGENTDWWSISSNWLGSGSPGISGWSGSSAATQRFPGDAVGPSTSHVMWTKPLEFGGVVGGTGNTLVEGTSWAEGSAYVNRYTNPIIVNGRIYYTEPVSFTGPTSGATYCVDLRTGEVIWKRTDVPALSFAYIYDVQDPNQHGVYPAILVASIGGRYAPEAWNAFDANTGNPLFNVTDLPSGTAVLGPQGEHLRYVIAPANQGNTTDPDWRLGQWNSSNMWDWSQLRPPIDATTKTTVTPVTTISVVNGVTTTTVTNVTTKTTAVDASISTGSHNRYDWNISLPWLNAMPQSASRGSLVNPVTVVAAVYNDVMICRNGSLPSFTYRTGVSIQSPYTYFAVNLNESKGTVGSVLWWKTYNAPEGNVTVYNGGADPESRVFLEMYKETMKWVGYSMTNGERLWTTESQGPFDYYGQPYYPILGGQIAYGKLYSSAYEGTVYCYDMATGELLWTYGNGGEGNSTKSGFYTAMGNYPAFVAAVGDGKIYTVTTEHTVSTPIYKGARTHCINATDGTEIWTLSAYTSSFSLIGYAIADGYANYLNGYNQQIYTVGKGPSATTVTASPKVSVHGSSVLVEGMVIDTAAGTTQDEQAARFPNGVPAVSDESMSDWMEYVYMQRPRPADVVGVEVVLTVLDPNNNYYEVGRTTSDADGLFHCAFTPEVPGEYTIIATFEGSEGYWPSHAATAINVEEAPAATPAPTPTPAPMTDTYVLGTGIAIIIAIAIVAFLLLRKR